MLFAALAAMCCQGEIILMQCRLQTGALLLCHCSCWCSVSNFLFEDSPRQMFDLSSVESYIVLFLPVDCSIGSAYFIHRNIVVDRTEQHLGNHLDPVVL